MVSITAENMASRVNEVFMDCLFRDGEDTTNHIVAEGIMSTYGFHPERLETHRNDIKELLERLPDEFKEGWSFLNACNDRDGEQWTGLHTTMEQLVVLGIALGFASYLMPRDLWSVMPGGMPYFNVNTETKDVVNAGE